MLRYMTGLKYTSQNKYQETAYNEKNLDQEFFFCTDFYEHRKHTRDDISNIHFQNCMYLLMVQTFIISLRTKWRKTIPCFEGSEVIKKKRITDVLLVV